MEWRLDHGACLALWALWCVLHSAFAGPATAAGRPLGGGRCDGYRLAYNLGSLLTLLPLAAWTLAIDTDPLFRWAGPLRAAQAVLVATGGVLFAAGARQYPLGAFLGIARGDRNEKNGRPFVTRGVLGAIRHPWYAGGILVLWAREASAFGLALNLLLSAYFVAGAFHEEQTLLRRYGEAYRRYREEVSMFFPWKWLRRRLRRRGNPGGANGA